MSNAIKTKFSIKDLENFTGIKSHTIRIWEKRYQLLEPSRTDTNIRFYDSDNFLKLLNINLLYNNGYKISKIAQFSESTLLLKAKELVSTKAVEEGALNLFKVAMLNFDTTLFNEAYTKLLATKTFREIFLEIFIPLLEHIGELWQTKSIKPVHEHFISNLITQKLQSNIERNQSINYSKKDKVFVLYLPQNEIHELGLLYLHFELTLRGYQSIYLGQNISKENITDLKEFYDNIHFISYFTVEPKDEALDDYINDVNELLIKKTNNKFWFLGRKAVENFDRKFPTNFKPFTSIKQLLEIFDEKKLKVVHGS
jgi:DNA-binding transcriptional MerR regulator